MSATEDGKFMGLELKYDPMILQWYTQDEAGVPESERVLLSTEQMEKVQLEIRVFSKLSADAGVSGKNEGV